MSRRFSLSLDRSKSQNAHIQENVYTSHLLVSQFPHGRPVAKGNFPARNKLMASLTDATVTIEASDTSGTVHQAAECVRLGRWLLIAKSLATNPTIVWTNSFLRQEKTRMLTETADVLDALALLPRHPALGDLRRCGSAISIESRSNDLGL